MKEKLQAKLDRVTRFEVINHTIEGEPIGRIFTTYDVNSIEMDFQDGGRTLKIFI